MEVCNKILTELSMTVITPNGVQLLGNSIALFWMGDGGNHTYGKLPPSLLVCGRSTWGGNRICFADSAQHV